MVIFTTFTCTVPYVEYVVGGQHPEHSPSYRTNTPYLLNDFSKTPDIFVRCKTPVFFEE